MPYYSFVMLCYNKWELTKQAINTLIESISQSHKNKGIELIIVNNGSSDETEAGIEQIKALHGKEIEIVSVHLEENMGYPVGANMGLAQCRGQIITMLNNDLVFPSNWFDGIVHTLENNPSIGAAVPFLSFGSGAEHLGVAFPSLDEMRKFAKKYMEENKDKLIYSERVIGACLSFKKDLFERIGGNDFWFGLGLYDDDDWSLRANIAGYKTVITGSSYVHHIGTVTFHQQSDILHSAFIANSRKFRIKWLKSGFDPVHRKEVINHTNYSRQEHFFPLKIDHFSKVPLLDKSKKSPNQKDWIMVADWLYDHSQWRKKLSEINHQTISEGENNLFLWIPKTYFPEQEIMKEAEKILDHSNFHIHYLFDEVPPIDILTFLKKYDVFLTVEGDYVNRYIRYLLRNAFPDSEWI